MKTKKGDKMNSNKLKEYRKRSGKQTAYLCEKLHITRPVLYKILDNPARCTYNQVRVLCKEFQIEDENDIDDIFLLEMSTK